MSYAFLEACRDLPPERISAPAPGRGFGSVLATLDHLVRADAGYLRALTGAAFPWVADESRASSLDVVTSRASDLARGWDRFLEEPLDAERGVLLDRGTYETHAGVIVAQVLQHGAAHREQVSAMLAASGVRPPDLQPWAYGDATGRGRRKGEDA